MIYEGYYIEELIHVWNVYSNYDAWRLMEPILHTAPSLDGAKQWVDQYLRHDVVADTEDLKSIAEVIQEMPFMPERGEVLPEYVAKELYPQEMLEVMVPPVSEYGRQVAADTARGYKEFLEGSNFTVKSKLEECSWSSEDVGYSGEIVHLLSGNSYAVFVHVFFDWRKPTENVVRFLDIWKEVEEGAPEVMIWEGKLDRDGGIEASKAVAEFEITGRGIED